MNSVVELLHHELETYRDHKDELLGTSEGRYVLVHDHEIVGVYDTEGDAIADGYRRFGNVPFLVKQVLAVDVPATFVSNLLAL